MGQIATIIKENGFSAMSESEQNPYKVRLIKIYQMYIAMTEEEAKKAKEQIEHIKATENVEDEAV